MGGSAANTTNTFDGTYNGISIKAGGGSNTGPRTGYDSKRAMLVIVILRPRNRWFADSSLEPSVPRHESP
jgi:hypothetical protein